jgi:hypothetical protein
MDETSNKLITNVMEEHHILGEKVSGTCLYVVVVVVMIFFHPLPA